MLKEKFINGKGHVIICPTDIKMIKSISTEKAISLGVKWAHEELLRLSDDDVILFNNDIRGYVPDELIALNSTKVLFDVSATGSVFIVILPGASIEIIKSEGTGNTKMYTLKVENLDEALFDYVTERELEIIKSNVEDDFYDNE